MPINIKNETVSRLANELAKETGESITEAVGKAVEEKLGLLRRKKSREGVAQKIKDLTDDLATRMPKEWFTWDYDADLYDEKGLPK